MGSMPVIFAFRFGFDAIFEAMGFSVVELEPVGAELDPDPDAVVVDVDRDAVPLDLPDALGLPDVEWVGLAVVGLLVTRVVVDTVGLPAVAGLPVVAGFGAVDGLPAVGGLLAGVAPCESASAGDTVRDAATTKPRIVA